MTKTTIGTLLIVLLFSLSFAPSCIYSADPRMEDVFTEQRNNVHSLAANMQQALKNGDKDNTIDTMIEEYLSFLRKHDTDNHPDRYRWSDWGYNRRKTEAEKDIDKILKCLEPSDFTVCRISIRPTGSAKRVYIDGNGKHYNDREAKTIQKQMLVMW